MRSLIKYGIGLILWLPGKLNAQRVIYSESYNTRSGVHFQVIGKSSGFYWVDKLQKRKSSNRRGSADIPDIQSFELFDRKLDLVKEIPASYIPGTLKQWLVAGTNGLDQVIITAYSGKTLMIGNHFGLDQVAVNQNRIIDSLPFSAASSDFLLVRSEDRSKILLVAFENTDPEFMRVYAFLYDADWNPIYHQVVSHIQFSQPCIQDEEVGFPAESFDNLPIKLANNGEWLMAFPSRISRNFTIFHMNSDGTEYHFREIPVSPFYKMEDIAMSIDNDLQQMSIGLLSGYSNTTFKNVQVSNYSMKDRKFYFDSSYRFNTQSREIQNKNLSHESFISVPGGGYMFLKEYGSPFDFNPQPMPFINNWEAAYLMTNYSEPEQSKKQSKQVYTSHHGLSPIPLIQNQGDLNLFYFPAISRDSTWSGILDMEQHTESNSPDLSYLMIPDKTKLFILYNSTEGSPDPLATTTTLNMHGQTTDDALIFWKMNKMLNFQQSHRFSADEVSVPYLNNQQAGFAIIRL